jgi:hypothetical protein
LHNKLASEFLVHHFYERRVGPQHLALFIVAAAASTGIWLLLKSLRGRRGAQLASCGMILWISTWFAEVISLHSMDVFLHNSLDHVTVRDAVWIVSSIMISCGVLEERRRLQSGSPVLELLPGCRSLGSLVAFLPKGDLVFRQIIRIVWYEEFNRARTVGELPVKLGLIYLFENVAENEQLVLWYVLAPTMLNAVKVQVVHDPFDGFSAPSDLFKTPETIFWESILQDISLNKVNAGQKIDA